MTGARHASPDTTVAADRIDAYDRFWWPIIILAVGSTCVIGSAGSIASVVFALLCMPMLFEPAARQLVHRQWDILVFPAFFVLLAICFAINADQWGDMVFLFNFTSLPLAVPVYILARRHSGGNWPMIIISLAFAGAALGTLFGSWQVLADGAYRATGWANNPNMYGHIILILGFLSLTGLFLGKSAWRFIFLAGPLLGIAGAVLSGSRGTLLAVPVAAGVALVYVLTQPGSRRWVFAGLTAACIALGVWLIFFARFDGGLARISKMPAILAEVLSSGTSQDDGMQARLKVYAGAWDAFLRSPLIGHGWAGAVPATIVDFEPSRELEIARKFRHMHSDFFGFAAGAGLIGITGYFAMLAAPFYSLRNRDALFWHRFYMAGILVSTYIVYGVLDAMFGFDTGISTFAFFTAIFAGTFCTGGPAPQNQPGA